MDNGNIIKNTIVMDVTSALQGIKQLEEALNKLKQNKQGSSISSNIGKDLNSAERIVSDGVTNINSKLGNIGNVKTSSKFSDSYSKTINELTVQAERYYRQFQVSGNTEFQDKYKQLIPVIRQLNAEQQSFNRTLGASSDTLGKLGSTLKSHFAYMATGALIGGIIGIPLAISNVAKETEVLTQKIRQNLELSEQYHGNNQILEQDLKRLNDIAGVFAIGYGVELKDVMESMQILSRRFKDVESIAYLTSAAITMNKLDFVDLKKASSDLEAVMLQYGLTARGTRDFLNDFSIAVHVARITGTELLDALQRSGSSFKQFNMGTRESIATVAALSTETARTGSTIGNTFKSVAANFSMKKAIEALDSYGIKLYDVNEQGMKTMRQGANVFQELQGLFGRLDDEGKSKLALAISGGKYQVNAMMAFLGDANQNFTTILNEIKAKSSDEMTSSLLKLGLDTYQVKLMQLQASMQFFSKTIGDDVLPSLKNMVDGLTNGVIWLTENHEAVSKTMSALVELAKVVTAFYIQQSISNKLIAEGTILLRGMYLLEGNFTAAFAGMRASLATFSATAAATCIQLAALYTAINVISAAYDRMSDKSGLVGQEQDTSNQLAAVEGNRKTALAMKARTGLSEDEINKIYDDQANDLRGKLASIQEQRKAKDNEATNKAQEESEKNFKAIIEKAMASATVKPPEISNLIPEKQGHSSNASTGPKTPPDNSEQVFRRDTGRELDHELKTAKISADQYGSALELLAAKEHIFGQSTEINATKLDLMNKRVLTLIGQSMQYEAMANEYETQANDRIASNSKLVEELDKQKISWSSLTKAEKEEFIQKYRSYIEDEKTLNKLLELADRARVASSETRSEANKIGISTAEMSVGLAKQAYDKSLRMLEYDKQHDISNLGYKATNEQKDIIDLAYSVHELTEAQTELNRVKKQFSEGSEEYKKQQAEVDKLKNKVDELNNKNLDKLKGQVSDMVIQWTTEGRSFSDIWKNIWQQFAQDALKALFRVQNSSGGLLSSLLGVFGGGAGGAAKGSGLVRGGFTPSNSWMPSTAFAFADGGIVDEPTNAIIGETGDTESVINLDKLRKGDKRQQGLLSYANSKLGTHVEAKVSQKTMDIAKTASVETRMNREHINELQKANALMAEQNRMILYMINNGNQGNTTVAQPIVMPSTQSDEALFAQLGRMRNMGYNV